MTQRLTQKWCLVAMLEELPDGYEFTRGNWPLHITLAGIHVFDWQNQKVQQDFSALLKSIKPVSARARNKGELGPSDNPTEVVFIEKSPELTSLHAQLIHFLSDKGAVFTHPEWNLDGYIPHSTVQKHAQIQPDSVLDIQSISLVDMFPRNDGTLRRITRTYKLS